MSKIMISPSILSAEFAKMGEGVENVEKWGADLVHCDVMDGVFVPNITFGMPMVKSLRKYSKLPFDVHLMITEPEKYVEEFCDSGADIVTFHPDASKDVRLAIDRIKAKGKKCGLVLNPDKPLSLIDGYWEDIDMLLIMSVYAGFGGQKFIPEVLDKVTNARKILKDLGRDIDIEIDGGINEENAKMVIDAGVNVIVAGSAVFKSSNPTETIKKLRG